MSRQEIVKQVADPTALPGAMDWVSVMVQRALKGGPVQITLGRPRRTKDQNRLLWPLLTDLSRQVQWHGETLTPEEWKDMMTAGIKRQRAVPGVDGGFVVLGAHTSRMDKAQFSELIEFIYAFGGDQGVEWTQPDQVDEALAWAKR